ncbi:MAG: hypothetical protein EZS28_005199 [Streblomastix strix]|uniref:Uncharacterized protein n=1 Tax=Streblomastix strix TaxID=222440 RepID=A0A5J4WY31_9EUKA|nr:MAG: hypothetical protein EZS28_005199 [Streblomastix strix]
MIRISNPTRIRKYLYLPLRGRIPPPPPLPPPPRYPFLLTSGKGRDQKRIRLLARHSEILEISEVNKIQIHQIYIPGLQNQIADSLSHLDQEAIATDAFQQSWRNQSQLIHPPIITLQKVVHKISMEKPRGIAIAPDWLGQPWHSDLELLSSKKISLGPCVNNLKPGRRMKGRKIKLPPEI